MSIENNLGLITFNYIFNYTILKNMENSKNHLIPIVKVGIGIVLLQVFKWIAVSIPITAGYGYYIQLAVSLFICFLLISFIIGYQKNLRQIFPSYPELAVILKNLTSLIVVIIAYNAILPLVVQYMRDLIWVLRLASIILGFYFLIKSGVTVYKSIDKLTNLLFGAFSKTSEIIKTKCPNCENSVDDKTKFCNNCGHKF